MSPVLAAARWAAFLLLGVPAQVQTAEAQSVCRLQVVDDLGVSVQKPVSVCTLDSSGSCVEWQAEAEAGRNDISLETGTYRLEGHAHGPATASLEGDDEGWCQAVVPRKATLTIARDLELSPSLAASVYRPQMDPDLIRPEYRFSLADDSILVPAGLSVVSLSERGWAPDLHVLTLAPGSLHEIEYQRRDGWSALLRATAASDLQPVPEVGIEIETLAGFDPQSTAADGKTRLLRSVRTSPDGFAAVSGLNVPMAGAGLRRDGYLEAMIPAFSSEAGTFRVFEARLHRGGEMAVQIDRELPTLGMMPARDAHCELFLPEVFEREEFGSEDAILSTQADSWGTCRAEGISAGSYALKVTLADESSATTIQPISIEDDLVTEDHIEMRPIQVKGRLLRGDEGVPGYEIGFYQTEKLGSAPSFPSAQAHTDDYGDYSLTVWVAGDYYGEVASRSTLTGVFRYVSLYGDTTVDFEIAVAEIEGRVVTTSGEALPEASLSVRLNGLSRRVRPDEEGAFSIPFREGGGGVARISASADGFYDSGPIEILVEPGQNPAPIRLVMERKKVRRGQVVTASGRPAAGAWLSVHPLDDPLRYGFPVERLAADASGSFDLPTESERVRIFYGGPGCPLGSLDLDPQTRGASGGPSEEPEPLVIQCRQPSHLLIRIIAAEDELKSRVPLLLRRDGVTIPVPVVEMHLASLGLPTRTDGQGFLGVVALEPGQYEIFHGLATSAFNVVEHHDIALLASVGLVAQSTVEVEATIDFSLN